MHAFQSTVITADAGQLVPEAAFKAALAKFSAGAGVLIRVNDHEIVREILSNCTLDELMQMNKGFQNEELTFYLRAAKAAQDDDIQPLEIVSNSGKMLLAGFLEGNFQQFSAVGSQHDDKFFAVKKYLLPMCSEKFNHFNNDVDKAMASIKGDSVFQMSLMNAIQGDGYIFLKAVNGEAALFSKGWDAFERDFDWGHMTYHCDYAETAAHTAPTSVPIVSTVDAVRARLNLPPAPASKPVIPGPAPAANPPGVHTVPPAAAPPPAAATVVDPPKREPVTETINGVLHIHAAPPAGWAKGSKREWYDFFNVATPQGFNNRQVPVAVNKGKWDWLQIYIGNQGSHIKWNDAKKAWELYLLNKDQTQPATAPAPQVPGPNEHRSPAPVHLPPAAAPPSTPVDPGLAAAIAIPLVNAGQRKEIKDFWGSKMMIAIIDKHRRSISDPALYQKMEGQLPKLTDQDVGFTWQELLEMPYEARAALCRTCPDLAAIAMKDLAHVVRDHIPGYKAMAPVEPTAPKPPHIPASPAPAPAPAPAPTAPPIPAAGGSRMVRFQAKG